MKTRIQKPSYVIFVPGGACPSVSHDTIESAREEAKRLVTSCGCRKAAIYQFMGGYEKVDAIKEMKTDPIEPYSMPF